MSKMKVPTANTKREHSKPLKANLLRKKLKSRGQENFLKRLYLSSQYCAVKTRARMSIAAGAMTA